MAVRTARDTRESDGPTDVRLAASRLENVDPAVLIAGVSGGELARLREAIQAIVDWSNAARAALASAEDVGE